MKETRGPLTLSFDEGSNDVLQQ